jgi:RNA polymerase sigma-54 factor
MTPQLQQAIKLLQLSRMELVDLVQQELQENPVLEEGLEVDEDRAGVEAAAPGESPEAPDSTEATASLDGSPTAEDATGDRAPTDAEKFADVDWQDYLDANPHTGMREVIGPDDRPSIDATYTRRETLPEHLIWQLQLASLPVEQEVAARFIIGNLDDRGYLQSAVEEISRQCGVREEVVELSLAAVQEFDPSGVAARDLRECLRIQARTLEISDPLVLRILDEQLDALIKRDFRGVSRALGVSIEEVAAASHVIGRLEPRPGRAFGGEDPVYIVPDIYVYRIGDDFHVVLNDDGLPRLRINALYREVLTKGNPASRDTKDYVGDKVRSAMWLIK